MLGRPLRHRRRNRVLHVVGDLEGRLRVQTELGLDRRQILGAVFKTRSARGGSVCVAEPKTVDV